MVWNKFPAFLGCHAPNIQKAAKFDQCRVAHASTAIVSILCLACLNQQIKLFQSSTHDTPHIWYTQLRAKLAPSAHIRSSHPYMIDQITEINHYMRGPLQLRAHARVVRFVSRTTPWRLPITCIVLNRPLLESMIMVETPVMSGISSNLKINAKV